MCHSKSSASITSTMCPAEPNGAAMRHKGLHQLIIAMSGSFDIVLDDGLEKKRFHLNRSYYGLYVCPMIWREIGQFLVRLGMSGAGVQLYDSADYYRDYD